MPAAFHWGPTVRVDVKFKAPTIATCVLLVLMPSAVMAQSTVSVPDRVTGVAVLHYDTQQAMAPVTEDRSNRTFIQDEYGNLYDGHGRRITPRPARLKR